MNTKLYKIWSNVDFTKMNSRIFVMLNKWIMGETFSVLCTSAYGVALQYFRHTLKNLFDGVDGDIIFIRYNPLFVLN